MLYSRKYTTMNFVLSFLTVCCMLLPTTWVAEGLSDQRLCADSKCQDIISIGTGKINYLAGEKGMVSFKINSKIRIKSKSAGSDPRLWGIEVNGREGYAPKEYIAENKVYISDKNLKYTVPVVLPGADETAAKPVPALKPYDNVGAKKEDLDLPTTMPMTNSLDMKIDTPIINSNIVPVEDVPPQITPVQQTLTVVDGTTIPILEEFGAPESGVVDVKKEGVIATTTDKTPLTETAINSDTDTIEPSSAQNELQEASLVQSKATIKEERSELNKKGSEVTVDDDDGKVEVNNELDTDSDIDDDVTGSKRETPNETLQPILSAAAYDGLNTEINAVPHYNPNATLFSESKKIMPENTNTANSLPIAEVDPVGSLGDNEREHNELGVSNDAQTVDIPSMHNGEVRVTDSAESSKFVHENTNSSNIFHTIEAERNLVGTSTYKVGGRDELPSANDTKYVDIHPMPNNEVRVTESTASRKISEKTNPAGNLPAVKAQMNSVENKEIVTPLLNVANGYQENGDIIQLNGSDHTQNIKPIATMTHKPGDEKNDIAADESKIDSLHKVVKSNEETKDNMPFVEKLQKTAPQATTETGAARGDSSVEITTEPSITEPGYQHYVDTREEAIDTTTEPTMTSLNTQAPESVISSRTENVVAVSEEPKTIVPSDLKEKPHVPNTQPIPIETEAVPHSRSDFNSQSPRMDSSEGKLNEPKKTSDKNVPTLPLFQPSSHHEHQHSHNQHDQSVQLHHHSHQHDIVDTPHNESEHADVNSGQTYHESIQHQGSEETQNQSYNFQPTQQHETSEETQSYNYESTFTPLEVNKNNNNDESTTSAEEALPLTTSAPPQNEPVAQPAQVVSKLETTLEVDTKKEQGLFATILGTVNSFLSNGKREVLHTEDDYESKELQRILFPERTANSGKSKEKKNVEYCEKISPNECPSHSTGELHDAPSNLAGCQLDLTNMSMDMLLNVAGNKMFEMSELLVCLAIVSVTCLFFLFVYYCFCNSSREGELLSKLNMLERSLLATHKENAILKEDLIGTRNKLSCIENNSFGSNDMVIALKKQLDDERVEKHQLQEQVGSLEKELENAAEAGLELNKIVSELLSSQTGDESIISSVEELQKQLNEQQKTILDINANLAEKSRENSELQLMIAEQNARLSSEIASLQQDNDELEVEKSNLQTRLEDVKREFEEDITKALEGKNFEIKRLQSELVNLNTQHEAEHTKYQTSLAKVEALEECLRTVRRDPNVNINQVIDVANVRADLLDIQKKYATLKERLDTETDSKKLAEAHLQDASNEIEKLKQDFHQSEKDKLEAQTRLEVLSNYFKEKETQLQKELSLKEAMWLKQQGETTSTVDRLTTMQEEIQSLKSQNDALRAEIEAQLAAHKAQTGTLENRAHETWLAARQSERRYEEARAEATALRRRLTSLAGMGGVIGEANFEKLPGTELNNAPSPIHMEPPGSPLLGRMPPPPFLPPPFMGAPPPFLGMPPPFVPPGEMRPPPLGRLMSPPPGAGSGGSGGGHLPPRGERYPSNLMGYHDYDDDDDDDYVDDDDDEEMEDEEEDHMRHRRRRHDSEDSYSPPLRTYRSQSPSDSRYNYTTDRDLISTYDTETDFNPSPRKPEPRGRRGSRTGSYRDYSPPPSASSPLNASSISNVNKRNAGSAVSKGHLSSGSDKSYDPVSQRHGGKKSSKTGV